MNQFERLAGKTENPKLFKLGEVEFQDAQQLAKEHPDTFEVPYDATLNAIEVGDVVKVCDGEERFWTVVKGIDGDTITAEVNNNLIGEQPYNYGDLIQYEHRHIYDIHRKEETKLMGSATAYVMELQELPVVQAYEVVEWMIDSGMSLVLVHALLKRAVETKRDQDDAENKPCNE